jgi:hypothetical protein
MVSTELGAAREVVVDLMEGEAGEEEVGGGCIVVY